MEVDRRAVSLWASWLAVAVWSAWWAGHMWPGSGLSWHYTVDGARLLLHGSGLNLFADVPWLQTGPLSLVLAALLSPLPAGVARGIALVAMAAAGPLLVASLAPLVAPEHRRRRVFATAIVLTPAWTVLAVRWGHLDDVLALVFAVVALRAVCASRPVLAGAAVALAIAAKPWAIGFFPLLFALPRADLRVAGAVAAAGVALAWLPFVLANRGTLTALHPPVGLSTASGLHTLGARGLLVPAWGRTAQLVLAPLGATVTVLTRGVPGVLLVAVAVRLALDPKNNAYYIGSAALAAVVFDLLGTRWTVPWTTLVTVILFWQPFVTGFTDIPHAVQTTTGLTHWWFAHQEVVGAVHVAWSVAVVALVFALPHWHRKSSDAIGAETPPAHGSS